MTRKYLNGLRFTHKLTTKLSALVALKLQLASLKKLGLRLLIEAVEVTVRLVNLLVPAIGPQIHLPLLLRHWKQYFSAIF